MRTVARNCDAYLATNSSGPFHPRNLNQVTFKQKAFRVRSTGNTGVTTMLLMSRKESLSDLLHYRTYKRAQAHTHTHKETQIYQINKIVSSGSATYSEGGHSCPPPNSIPRSCCVPIPSTCDPEHRQQNTTKTNKGCSIFLPHPFLIQCWVVNKTNVCVF